MCLHADGLVGHDERVEEFGAADLELGGRAVLLDLDPRGVLNRSP